MKTNKKNRVHYFLVPIYIIAYMLLIGLIANLITMLTA